MKRKSPVPAAKYLEGAGLALKAGQKFEAAEFFLKGGEFETAAILFEKIGRHDRAAVAHEKAENTVEAAAVQDVRFEPRAVPFEHSKVKLSLTTANATINSSQQARDSRRRLKSS